MPEVRLPFQMTLPEDLWAMARAFEKEGYQLYVVGGAVRDAVLGKEPKDFDVATNATPDQVLELLAHIKAWKTDEVGKAFGVIRARLHNPDPEVLCREYEIATFREDMSAGRHPEIRFATIVEDVQRRDLTINALFYDIQKQEIVDLVGGLDDIKAQIVRTVGKPEDRFHEDRLRILRAIRFAVKLDYKIAPITYAAIHRDNNLTGVSFERIRDELTRAISSAVSPTRLMRMMDGLDMWKRVLPGMQVSSKVGMRLIDTSDVAVTLALLLDDNDHGDVAKRLNYLKYSANEAAQISFLIRFKGLNLENAYKMRKAANAAGVSNAQLEAYARGRRLYVPNLLRPFLQYQPTVDGNDVLAAGFIGPAVGKELERREAELFVRLSGANA